jgi:hypothetical protein
VRGRDVDDAAPSVLDHGGQRKAGGVECRRHVDGDDRVPLSDREFLDRRDMLDAGIVHQDVESAVGFDRRFDHFRDLRRLGHVGRRMDGVHGVVRGQLRGGLGDLLPVAEAVEHHRRAVRGERAGDGESDAAGRSGDERDLAFQRARGVEVADRSGNVHGGVLKG